MADLTKLGMALGLAVQLACGKSPSLRDGSLASEASSNYDQGGRRDLPPPDAATDSAASDMRSTDAASLEQLFVDGRQEVRCDGVYPVCVGKVAGCVLGSNEYVSGHFPGTRKLLVNTPAGDWKIKVLLFLDQKRAPGTETEVSWFEPGCSQEYRYRLSEQAAGQDLFQTAGDDSVLEVEQAVVEAGDHLVELYSDATCRYLLRAEVVPAR